MWTPDFKARLADRVIEPIIIIDVGEKTGADLGWGTLGINTSHRFVSDYRFTDTADMEEGSAKYAHYLLTDYQSSRQSVRLQVWETNPGGFRFSLTSRIQGGTRWPIRPTRGLPVRVWIGFADYSFSDFQTVDWGIVDQISKKGDTWQIECRSIVEAMRMRFPGKIDPALSNFPNAGKTTALEGQGTSATDPPLSTNFQVGSGNYLAVADNSIFDLEAGSVGCAKITSDTVSTPWYYVYNGTTTTGGQDYLTPIGTEDWFGNPDTSTNYTVAANSIVTSMVAFGDAPSPWGLFETLLIGSLPAGWGLSLLWGIVDTHDIRALEDSPSTGGNGTRWSPMAEAPVDDLWRWMKQGLAELNMFPIMREGQISLNVAASFAAISGLSDSPRATITDDYIVSIDEYKEFHPDCRAEFFRVVDTIDRLGMPTYGSFGVVASFPWLYSHKKTIAAEKLSYMGIEYSNIIPSNTLAIPRGETTPNATTVDHLELGSQWYCRLPQRFTFTLATLRYAYLALGDIVWVASNYVYAGKHTDDHVKGIVTDISVDWMRGRVKLSIASFSLDRNTFDTEFQI